MAKNLIWVKGVLLPPPDIDGYNAPRLASCGIIAVNIGRRE